MRLGIYGGSFDPVHNAHLALARACQQHAELDQVWFVPTSKQPLKQQGPQASNDDRIEMLRLATDDEPSWQVCTLETDRGGMSYTAETVRQMREQLPNAKLYFLMGADLLRDLAHWFEPGEIFRLATPLVVRRAGQAEPDVSLLKPFCTSITLPQQVEFPAVDVSSSDIRGRVLAREPIDELVPPAVATYVAERGLYRGAGVSA